MNTKEDWQEDYATDTGMTAFCPKCGEEAEDEVSIKTNPAAVFTRWTCPNCGHKQEWTRVY